MIVEEISKDLMLDKNYLLVLQKRNNMYKKYYVTKKNGSGEKRKIMQPSGELKTIQYWLNTNIFSKMFINKEVAMAYEVGSSISKNAYLHKENKYILHLDIKDFFPSITRSIIKKLFEKQMNNLSISKEDIEYILNIILYRGVELTIGSVSAPLIANRILYNFDNALLEYLSSQEQIYVYTRYADDIVISSKKKIDISIIDIIDNLLKTEGFNLNRNKTYFMYSGAKRQVTGIVIDNNNNQLSIGSKRIRDLKRQIYNYLIKKDKTNAEEKIKIKEKLLGKLAFVKSVSNKQYENLKNTYTKYESEDTKLF